MVIHVIRGMMMLEIFLLFFLNAIVGTLVKTVKTNATSTVRWAVDVIRQQGNVKGAV